MPRTVAIGEEFFNTLRERDLFYVDKTDFIRQWWDDGAKVTAIMRPRRFGKTLAMNTVECFFSVKYAGRGDLFDGLRIWDDARFREIQGTFPVLSLSFVEVKGKSFADARESICRLIQELYMKNDFLLGSNLLKEKEKEQFGGIGTEMSDSAAASSLRNLTDFLSRYYGKNVILLLDEYDTPMQEAYFKGYWEELASFLRPLFGSTFKGNPYLERALMTGITRVAKESIFSDLNNLKVITATSNQYEECFGFTQQEVSDSLREFGLSGQADSVKRMYDGFTFGRKSDIYNPWSITSYLDSGKLGTYWVNTSSNSLISKLLKQASGEVKMECEKLLEGGSIHKPIDEQIVFSQLGQDDDALWSFMLASGYLKVLAIKDDDFAREEQPLYELALTNGEVRLMFRSMIRDWFSKGHGASAYKNFLRALLQGSVDDMNDSLNRVTQSTFSFFDASGQEPERFYHGFVLGLMACLDNDYFLRSNRESGNGRYDVLLEPKDREKNDAIIIELKAREAGREKSLESTVESALKQIEEKNYDQDLLSRGFQKNQIRKYGFAFDGKTVLIGS